MNHNFHAHVLMYKYLASYLRLIFTSGLFHMNPTGDQLYLNLTSFRILWYVSRTWQDKLIEASPTFLSFIEQELWLLKIMRKAVIFKTQQQVKHS